MSLWPWLQDQDIVQSTKLWIYFVVSVCAFLLCGDTRPLASLSLRDQTLPACTEQAGMPLSLVVSCVQEKNSCRGAVITDTFDFLLHSQHNIPARLWVQAGGMWKTHGLAVPGQSFQVKTGPELSLVSEERRPPVDVQA